jgi:hypothetical protein
VLWYYYSFGHNKFSNLYTLFYYTLYNLKVLSGLFWPMKLNQEQIPQKNNNGGDSWNKLFKKDSGKKADWSCEKPRHQASMGVLKKWNWWIYNGRTDWNNRISRIVIVLRGQNFIGVTDADRRNKTCRTRRTCTLEEYANKPLIRCSCRKLNVCFKHAIDALHFCNNYRA